jgi:hypothetical protein
LSLSLFCMQASLFQCEKLFLWFLITLLPLLLLEPRICLPSKIRNKRIPSRDFYILCVCVCVCERMIRFLVLKQSCYRLERSPRGGRKAHDFSAYCIINPIHSWATHQPAKFERVFLALIIDAEMKFDIPSRIARIYDYFCLCCFDLQLQFSREC